MHTCHNKHSRRKAQVLSSLRNIYVDKAPLEPQTKLHLTINTAVFRGLIVLPLMSKWILCVNMICIHVVPGHLISHNLSYHCRSRWCLKRWTHFQIFVTVHQGRMSVETADRVAAVTSSRPSTPLQTSWFEFLLDGSLLENHLQKSYPGQLSVAYYVYYTLACGRFVIASLYNKPI